VELGPLEGVDGGEYRLVEFLAVLFFGLGGLGMIGF
jgi:hypothetical protein